MNFKEIANEANKLEDEIGLNIDDVLNKLTQELGEFNDAVQKYRGRYCRSRLNKEDLEKEAGDVLINLISILNRIGIEPQRAEELAEKTLKKFKEKKGDYIACKDDKVS
jgi:NTP pyrophosphatase (non-canonical NTP hydrolase)